MTSETLRDHFAAAALTGLLARGLLQSNLLAADAYKVADAMLRERERKNHDAAPAARGDARECTAPVTTGGTQWLNYNANDYVRVKLTAHGRELLKKTLPSYTPPTEDADGWSRWQLHRLMNVFGEYMVMGLPLCFETAIRLEAVPPNHDAAPAARANAESVAPQPTAGDRAGNPPSHSGTGDTPKPINDCVSDRPKPINGPDPDSRVWETPVHTPAPHATPGEGSVPREGTQEPVAWAVACDYGDYAVALFSDEASAQTEADRRALVGLRPGYVVVPLYRHPPVTETHTPATHATRGEGSVQRECTEPVAWAVMPSNSDYCVTLSTRKEAAKKAAERKVEVGEYATMDDIVIVPLYRQPQPTLTEAEREAIKRAVDSIASTMPYESQQGLADWKTLRGLLERLGGVE